MTDKTDLILQKLVTIQKDIQGVKSELHVVKTDLNGVKSELHVLKTDLNVVKTEQRQQGDLLIQLIGFVKSTNEKVTEIQYEVSAIVKIQEKQHKILETLALRSLEQETEIREIKRIK